MGISQANMAPVRKKHPAGPFSKEHKIWIVLEFGAYSNMCNTSETQLQETFFLNQIQKLFHKDMHFLALLIDLRLKE